jgi:2'-5' RNA ligase
VGKKEEKPAVKRRKRGAHRDDPPVRAFCAITLDNTTDHAMRDALRPIRDSLRSFNWVHPTDWHITLKFYGEIPSSGLPELGQALRAVAGPEVPVSIRGMGAFPDMREPRVIWVGVDDPGGLLLKLYRRINDVSSELGYEPEDRRYKPHITVARAMRGASRPVARELTTLMGTNIADTTLRELVLFTSERSPDGPIYRAVERIPLGGK